MHNKNAEQNDKLSVYCLLLLFIFLTYNNAPSVPFIIYFSRQKDLHHPHIKLSSGQKRLDSFGDNLIIAQAQALLQRLAYGLGNELAAPVVQHRTGNAPRPVVHRGEGGNDYPLA